MCTTLILVPSYTYKLSVDASHDIFFKNLLAEYTQQLNKMLNKMFDRTEPKNYNRKYKKRTT